MTHDALVSLTELMQARITEQEIRCRTLLETAELSPAVRRALSVALADCEAMRRIIEVQELALVDEPVATWELMALAFTYSDHPDCRRAWAP